MAADDDHAGAAPLGHLDEGLRGTGLDKLGLDADAGFPQLPFGLGQRVRSQLAQRDVQLVQLLAAARAGGRVPVGDHHVVAEPAGERERLRERLPRAVGLVVADDDHAHVTRPRARP